MSERNDGVENGLFIWKSTIDTSCDFPCVFMMILNEFLRIINEFLNSVNKFEIASHFYIALLGVSKKSYPCLI